MLNQQIKQSKRVSDIVNSPLPVAKAEQDEPVKFIEIVP